MQTKTHSGFQLSPQQKRLWLLQQNSSAYLTQCAIFLEGTLKPDVLKAALQQIIHRHGILRTSFRRLAGVKTPVMVVGDNSFLLWQDIDLSDWHEQEHSAKIEEIFQEAIRQGFDFEQNSLLCLSLVKLSKNTHILHVCLPALCADTWTIKNLLTEISNLYRDGVNGEKSCDEVIQYLQVSEWQNQLLKDQEAKAAQEYWGRQKLSSIATLKLPFESNSTKRLEFEPGCFRLAIDPDVNAKLETLARKYDTSAAVLLLACWQTLLWRLTGHSDIIIGTASDRREYEELHDVLGLIATWLPIRCHLVPDLRFTEVIELAQKTISDGKKWQDYFVPEPLENDNTLAFPIGFEFEQLSGKYLAGNISFSVYKQYSCIEQFKVKLTCTQHNDSLSALFYYDINYFCADIIQRVAEQFQTLLASATENPDVAISQLEILSKSAQQQLLVEFNQTQVDYQKNKCIHELFEQQVLATANNIALVFEDQQLTYAELNAHANQLAHHLLSLGVGPETIVALCVERSLETFIGLLGILKAGGAYLPLDPTLPNERLTFLLQDAQASVILTQQHLAQRLSQSMIPVVCLDTDHDAIAQQPSENLPSHATLENLVYVIYTSGSMGKPKGVAIEHQQLFNYLHGILERLDIPVSSSFATVSTFAADLGNTAIFASLCTGGCLHIISQERATNPEALANYTDRHPIDCLKIVPSHLSVLLATAVHPEKILPRACLILGGETASWQLIEKVQQYAPNCRIINHYGPTEATVGVLTYQVKHQKVDQSSQTVPLGRPLANTQIYLLDSHNKPVPIGVPGELHIAGAGLARSYLNQPELTREKFIPNPFNRLQVKSQESKESARLYKTGDQARYLPDGNIEFLGRIDNQVKIRGFRIELGEIEAILGQHPELIQSAVITREDTPGDQRLVAYLVAKQQSAPTITDLRHFLQQQLPEYMIPNAFVLLDALPLTPNGKVDHRALPAPEVARPELEGSFVVPRTPIEEMLALIWAAVLGVEQVGIHDNFFELGGHSLLATQVVSRIRQALSVELPLADLFEFPSIASLAESLEPKLRSQPNQKKPPIEPAPREGNLLLSFAQQRLWFLEQFQPNTALYNIAQALKLNGLLNYEALKKALAEIVARHESLRTTFVTQDETQFQVIAEDKSVELPVIDLSQLSEPEQQAEVEQLSQQQAVCPFDLSRDLMLRTTLLRLGSEEHILVLVMHHIASDGWSIGIFFNELAALYNAYLTGVACQLPELPIQYADFAYWQRQPLYQEILNTQLAYWKQQLEGIPALLELPTDRVRPAIQSFKGARHSFVLPAPLTSALKTLSQLEGVTLFMTLLAAFKTLLYRLSGQSDIVVGSPIAGRHQLETEGLIGFFVNTLVLRTRVQDDATFRDLLTQVRSVALGAYAHQDLPFEKLVEELQPERNLSNSPLFQVMFVLQNTPSSDCQLSGLCVNSIKLDSGTAKFDLTLSMKETQQGLKGSLNYNTDLFDAATIERMAVHFQTLLEAIVANPEQKVAQLPLLTSAQRHQLLVDWNNTKVDYPFDKCIHQLFEAQVEQTPDAVAVVFEGEQLTYRQLNARANQLAHYLQKQGVKPEVLVGLCVERSLEMIVGLLGILKAGGAYVPLDPAYPGERLAFMLEEAQVPVLLTQQKLLQQLPEHTAQVVCLDTNWEANAFGTVSPNARENAENPASGVTSTNLAYVIYTSGSTGKPKGVLIEHLGVCNLIKAQIEAFGVQPASRILQFASISFDASVSEIFGALLGGARLYLETQNALLPGPAFIELLRERAITIVKLPPSVLAALPDVELPAWQTKTIICAGEACSADLVRRWAAGRRFINVYGPTETTIAATFAQWSDGSRTPPIGRPFANKQVYILDTHQQPVPIGVTGELYIGGVGVARGYLNRPELTAQKFIRNPFSQKSEARSHKSEAQNSQLCSLNCEFLYKTGDLVRYLPDGNIEYLGRIDNQVKLRGFRIELGEIEAVLIQHPAVQQAVAIVREDVPGDKRLVAYIITKPQQAATTGELRHFLKQKLPDYMVPSAWVELDQLPLTPNGKIDRRALPTPSPTRTTAETFVPPRTPIEEILVNIWTKILNVEPIGIYDNFFELGGHSLKVTQVVSRIRQALGVDLPLADLFESATVAELAERIQRIYLIVKLQASPFEMLDNREEVEL